MEIIKSVNNQTIREIAKLKQKKYRDVKGQFLAEGEHLVEEARKAGVLRQVIVRAEASDEYDFEDAIYVTNEVMKKLSDTVSLLDVVGICDILPEKPYESDKILILDGIQDPGNLGTLIRTAISFGFNDIIASPDTVDFYNEKVLRSTQGAIFRVNIHRNSLIPEIHELKARGYKVFGTSLMNGKSLTTFEKEEKVAIVLGNEGSGVRTSVFMECDRNIYIDMIAFESLNVAVAGGIILYHFK